MIVDSEASTSDLLFQACDAGLALVDASGRVQRANEAFASLVHCPLSEIGGLTVSELLPEGTVTGRDDPGVLPAEWRKHIRTATVRFTSKRLPDGNTALTALPYESSETKADIVEGLKESLSLAMQGGKLGVWTRDFRTGLVEWSPELEQIFGLEPNTFAKDEAGFFEFIHPDDHAKVRSVVEESLRTGNDYQVEFRIKRKDGSEGWMDGRGRTIKDADGKPILMAGVGIDITNQKLSEEALAKSESRYRGLVDILPAGVCTCGADGVINFFNRRAVEIWGRTPPIPDPKERFCGSFQLYTLDGQLIPPEENPVAVALRTGSSFRGVEARVVRPDGTSVIAEVNIDPFRDESGQIVGAINVFLNVSERHKVGEELRTLNDAARLLGSTLDLPTIYDHLRDLVASVLDCDNMLVSSFDPESKMVTCSYAWMDGSRADASVFPPVKLAPEGRGMQSTVIRTGEPLLVEDAIEGRKKCVTSVIVDADGTIRDEQSDDQPATRSIVMVPVILEGAVIGVVQVMSYRVSAYNDSHVRLLQGMVQQMAVAVQNARLYQEAHLEIARRENLEAELEQRVLDRTRELEAANRELEGFTYNVSHDLRAPLRAIISAAMILLEDHRDQVEPLARNELQRMATAASKMGRLIDDLLQYSRLGRTDVGLRKVDLTNLAAETVDNIATRHARPMVVKIDPNMSILADPVLFKLALENLVDNSFKYGKGPSGSLWIGRVEGDGPETFYVRDDGIGFDPQYAHKIFQPFERLVLDSQYPGTGIGLANVKRIFERHGGKIWAESSPGNGSTFFFTLS